MEILYDSGFRAVDMKQKIYSFIIIFVSVMIFLSFSLLNIKNDDTGEFEVTFISSNTEISETPPTPASTSRSSNAQQFDWCRTPVLCDRCHPQTF